ncbi:dephospho-CoA kinase [Bacteroidia bacterium]|nr:dephospho-CoA kinase [Bacteroidia bacterium]
MLKVGITGGIGSGKSVVCRLFALLGIPVYDSDRRARELMNTSAPLMEGIRSIFGQESYCNGELDRRAVAREAFSDRTLLDRLNALVHPAVMEDFGEWTIGQKGPYVLLESAILFESGLERHIDLSIRVDAPPALRLERVVERDGATPGQVARRMANQSDAPHPSDFVIDNSGGALLWPQVLAIDNALRKRDLSDQEIP